MMEKATQSRPYVETVQAIGELVEEKQAAYGDSFGKAGEVMRILYPDGITPDNLNDALTVTRILDKLFRIANKKDAFGESPYRDIAGYALLAVVRDEAGKLDNHLKDLQASEGLGDGI